MIIDGNDLQSIAVLHDRGPSRSAATVRQLIAGAPGAWRRVRLGRGAPEPLLITVDGWVIGNVDSPPGTQAQMQTNLDALKFWTRPDKELTISFSDISGRQWKGSRQSLQVAGIAPEWLTEGVAFALRILCPVPYAEETSAQSDDTSGAAPLVLTPTVGTAPMPVVITITGNAGANLENPVLHYRNGADADVETLAYAGTLVAGAAGTLVIDTGAMTAELNGVNVAGDMTGTYFDINPGDGDLLGSPTGPDVQLTADSGTADDFQLDWRRLYL